MPARRAQPECCVRTMGAPCVMIAFVVHAPVLVLVSLALQPWAGPAALKFAVAAALATVLSFAVAGALLRLPGARRVL